MPRSAHTVSCQTVASALVPCEACACVQAVMKESSDALVSLCRSLGLPCSMQGFLEAVEETQQLGRLSACDISQWASEQRKDMSRVGKHVLEVRVGVLLLGLLWLFTLLSFNPDYTTIKGLEYYNSFLFC